MIIRTITSLDKSGDTLESITTLVGPDWGPCSLEECIAWAKQPGHQLVVRGAISTQDVIVAQSKVKPGQEILQTRGDRLNTDTLLTLKGIPKLENFFGSGKSVF